jgi:hypothetical protein
MVFQVNDGPMVGKSGDKLVTSRHLGERLRKESYANPSIVLEPGEAADEFRVLGRGELQLAVLIETMRRESYGLCVRNPQVVTREVNGALQEPLERLVIDVAADHTGAVIDLLGRRRGTLKDQTQEGSRVRLEYTIPTRELFGLRHLLLTATRGTEIDHFAFDSSDQIQVFGLGGNDSVTVQADVNLPTALDGGPGDDTLSGGSGADTLLGQAGNDLLADVATFGEVDGPDQPSLQRVESLAHLPPVVRHAVAHPHRIHGLHPYGRCSRLHQGLPHPKSALGWHQQVKAG